MDAGWQPDPFGRHEYRFHDGTAWTEHVSDAGEQSTDPPTPGPTPPDGAVALPSPAPALTPQPLTAPTAAPTTGPPVTTTTIRVHTHRSVFWWFFIGWWYVPIKWLIGFPIVIYRRIRGHRPGDIKVEIETRHDPPS